MYDAYLARTPNGFKISIVLEELGVPYEAHQVRLDGQQHEDWFTAINPNAKIPALVDRDGPGGLPHTIIESGAILLYLAQKHGRFLSADPVERSEAIQWLMFQVGGIGPMFGQFGHFRDHREQGAYSYERYGKECKRLLAVLDKRLEDRTYLAGDYSIADIATWPWVRGYKFHFKEDLSAYANVERWLQLIGERPAAQRGLQVFR